MGGDLSFESNSLCSLWLCILEFIEILYMCVNDCASVYLSLEMFYSLPPLSPFSSIWFSKKSRKFALICVHRLTFPVAQTVKHLPTMWETWVQSLNQEDHLEKEMVTHSSILAWKIQWAEEPGGLQTMGLQRVRHDWATSFYRLNKTNRNVCLNYIVLNPLISTVSLLWNSFCFYWIDIALHWGMLKMLKEILYLLLYLF